MLLFYHIRYKTWITPISAVPQINVTAPANTAANTDVVIPCTITSDSAVTVVVWEVRPPTGAPRNITTSNHHYGVGTPPNADLTIKSASNSDDGQYSCYARNADGWAKSNNISVDIIGNDAVQCIYSVTGLIWNPVYNGLHFPPSTK